MLIIIYFYWTTVGTNNDYLLINKIESFLWINFFVYYIKERMSLIESLASTYYSLVEERKTLNRRIEGILSTILSSLDAVINDKDVDVEFVHNVDTTEIMFNYNSYLEEKRLLNARIERVLNDIEDENERMNRVIMNDEMNELEFGGDGSVVDTNLGVNIICLYDEELAVDEIDDVYDVTDNDNDNDNTSSDNNDNNNNNITMSIFEFDEDEVNDESSTAR